MFLDLAASWGVFLLNLDGPKEILPDVLEVSGVSEGKDGVILVDRDDGSDCLNVFLDNTASDWFVGLIASDA